MAGTTADSSVSTGVPERDKIIFYASDNSALILFGDPASPKMALLCPGFPDDHTVFLPFAKALSETGGLFVGVMCLPGFDDREEAPWTTHKPDGYTFDEMTMAVREAAKVLRAASTHGSPEFTGIFHDWGVFPGTQWASRVEEEATDVTTSSDIVKPDKLVFLDVLLGPSPKAENIPTNVQKATTKETICGNLYMIFLATGFFVQRYIYRPLAPLVALPPLILFTILDLMPTYEIDNNATDSLYGDKKPGLNRLFYMTYPYLNHFKVCWSERNWGGAKTFFTLHKDWKATPVLYLYGKKKKTQFHNYATLKMLEEEEADNRSLSKAVGIEDAGHFLFVQKHDECLKYILDFVGAENTFVSSE
jgi:pimeloyl-ACP methyl ester carboxylesterase